MFPTFTSKKKKKNWEIYLKLKISIFPFPNIVHRTGFTKEDSLKMYNIPVYHHLILFYHIHFRYVYLKPDLRNTSGNVDTFRHLLCISMLLFINNFSATEKAGLTAPEEQTLFRKDIGSTDFSVLAQQSVLVLTQKKRSNPFAHLVFSLSKQTAKFANQCHLCSI